MLAEDLILFTQAFCPHLFPLPPPRPHFEIADLLVMGRERTAAEKEWDASVLAVYGPQSPAPRRVAIAMSRGLGKSRLLSIGYTLQQAVTRGAEDILLVSATASLVEGWIRIIRRELEQNDLLRDLTGDLVGTTWRDDCLELANGVTIRACGRGAQIRGQRNDLVIVDDLEDEEESRSELQREYLEEWFERSLKPTIKPHGRMILIGTPVHPDCLLWQIVGANDGKGRKGWVTRVYPASSKKEGRGKATWPELWPNHKLVEIRDEIGSLSYAREYDCEPVPDSARIFLRKHFEEIEPLGTAQTKGMWKVMCLDPSLGEDDQHDPSAYVVLGVHRDGKDVGKARVLEVATGKWGFDKLLETGFALYRKWDCRYWCYEGVAFQKVIRPAVIRMGREKYGGTPRMVEMHAVGDKIARAQGVQYLVEQGLVGWPKGKYVEELREIANFPEVAHDDVTDAFVYCLKAWELYCSRSLRRLHGHVPVVNGEKLGHVGGWQEHENRKAQRRAERRKRRQVTHDVTGLF